jgi:hypothetical protein
MSDALTYSFRAHAFVKEATWRIEDGMLTCEQQGQTMRFPLAGATDVRLVFDPARVAYNRFGCNVRFRDGREAVLLNQSYSGFADFEDRSGSYVPFVRALIARIAQANPACRFHAGKPALGYVASLAFLFAIFLLLALVLWVTETVSLSGLVTVKLIIIAAMLPTLYLYVRKNRPRPFEPAAIPDDLLPSAEIAR